MTNLGKLRLINEAELELVREWRNLPKVRANMYTQHEISNEEHLNWWRSVACRPDNLYLMYEYEGQALGVVYFNKIDTIHNNASWGFYASPHAPKGVGTKMEFLALEYSFSVLSLNKLYCEVLSHNSSVIRLHEKFGFCVEGVFKEQYKFDGVYVDVFRLGMLSKDWPVKRIEMEIRVAAVLK